MEFWDVYDKNRMPKGYKIMRGGDRRLANGEYHLTAHVCLFAGDGRMVIQRRADFKGLWGGLWDISASGSVLAGESSLAGAQRELFEEIGVKADFGAGVPIMTFYGADCISDYYVALAEIEPSDLTLQFSEVSAVRLATREEVLELAKEGKFVPYKRSFLELIFDMNESESKRPFEWRGRGEYHKK